MAGIEFLRVARLSGQHLSVPRSFLREQGFSGAPGNKNEYAALFRVGRALAAVFLRPDEGVADAEKVVRGIVEGQSFKNSLEEVR